MAAPLDSQVLYQLALSIGVHRALEPMLQETLTAFVQHLSAQAGAIYQMKRADGSATKTLMRAEIAREAHQADLSAATAYLDSDGPLPTELPGSDGLLWLMEIPGFGALCLIQGNRTTDSQTLTSLRPLLAALGRASETSLHIEEEASLEETRMMADMLAARTRELAARTRELDVALQRARDVSRLKEELLASLSHELRTPLNAVLGMSEALQEEVYGPLTPGQKESLEVIAGSGRKLLTILSDMMDFVRIGAGQMDTALTPCDADEIAQLASYRAREVQQAKNIRLVLDSDLADSGLLTDGIKCQRIINELVSNALKFTPEGGRVGIEVRENQEANTVEWTIWDTGCGIAAHKLAQLFEPFVQLQGGLKRRFGGTGLGLALNSRLARLIGAELSVESVEGQGSRFTLSVPRTGPTKLHLFGDLNCPFSYILNLWIEETRMGHLITWRGVEHLAEISPESADTTAEQESLDAELEHVHDRSLGQRLTRPVRRSNTRNALCALNFIAQQAPERISEARSLLFHAVWKGGMDISTLEVVRTVLRDFPLGDYEPGAAELQALEADTLAWRSHNDPQLPVMFSPVHKTTHRGLGHRALLHQFLEEELGFVGRNIHEMPTGQT